MKKIKIGDIEFELGKFNPCLVYYQGLGCLSVHLKDCSIREVRVTDSLDLLYNMHPKTKDGELVGFNLWKLHEVLGEKGYTKSSISLEHLLKRIDKYVLAGPCEMSALGEHKETLLAIAREHQFVWRIPPNLLLK